MYVFSSQMNGGPNAFWWVNVYHTTSDDGKADIASQLNNLEQLSKLLFTYSSRAS